MVNKHKTYDEIQFKDRNYNIRTYNILRNFVLKVHPLIL